MSLIFTPSCPDSRFPVKEVTFNNQWSSKQTSFGEVTDEQISGRV